MRSTQLREEDTSCVLSAWHEAWHQEEGHGREWGEEHSLRSPGKLRWCWHTPLTAALGEWGAQRTADCLIPQEVRVAISLATYAKAWRHGGGFPDLWKHRDSSIDAVFALSTAHGCQGLAKCLCFRSLLTCVVKLLRDASRHSRD